MCYEFYETWTLLRNQNTASQHLRCGVRCIPPTHGLRLHSMMLHGRLALLLELNENGVRCLLCKGEADELQDHFRGVSQVGG